MLRSRDEVHFDWHGLLTLREALPASAVSRLADHVWSRLARHGIHRDHPESWRRARPKGLQAPARSGELDAVCSDAVREAIDGLLGPGGWKEPEHWGQPLVSLPSAAAWHLPHTGWHVDLPDGRLEGRRPGVQIFAILESIPSHGGATVAVAGSHRLVQAVLAEGGLSRSGGSARLRKELAQRYPWFRRLWSRDPQPDREAFFMESPTEVGGGPVQVVELTGEAGDVVLMHPYIFHTAAPNAGSRPRIAVTQRLTAL